MFVGGKSVLESELERRTEQMFLLNAFFEIMEQKCFRVLEL